MSTSRRTHRFSHISEGKGVPGHLLETGRVTRQGMGRLVMKFGGTSVADVEHVRNVARHVEREVKAGHQVAVVVSAMAGTTDQLAGWCREAGHAARPLPPPSCRSAPLPPGQVLLMAQGDVNMRNIFVTA